MVAFDLHDFLLVFYMTLGLLGGTVVELTYKSLKSQKHNPREAEEEDDNEEEAQSLNSTAAVSSQHRRTRREAIRPANYAHTFLQPVVHNSDENFRKMTNHQGI